MCSPGSTAEVVRRVALLPRRRRRAEHSNATSSSRRGVVGAGELERRVRSRSSGSRGRTGSVVSGGVESARQRPAWRAGVGSGLPSVAGLGVSGRRSRAPRTRAGRAASSSGGNSSSRLWVTTPPRGPSPRQSYQSSSLVLSSRHSKSSRPTGVWSSVPVKLELVSLCRSRARVSDRRLGRRVSAAGMTSHSYSVGSSSTRWPSVSVAVTRKMCSPTARPGVGHRRACTPRTGPCRSSTRTRPRSRWPRSRTSPSCSSVSPPLAGSPFSPGSYAGPERIVVIRPVIVPVVDGRRRVDAALDVDGAHPERVRADLVVLELVLVGENRLASPGRGALPRAAVELALEA